MSKPVGPRPLAPAEQKLQWFAQQKYTVITRDGQLLGWGGILYETLKSLISFRLGNIVYIFQQAWSPHSGETKRGLERIIEKLNSPRASLDLVQAARKTYNTIFPQHQWPEIKIQAVPEVNPAKRKELRERIEKAVFRFNLKLSSQIAQESQNQTRGFSAFSILLTVGMLLKGMPQRLHWCYLNAIHYELTDIDSSQFIDILSEMMQEALADEPGVKIQIGHALAIKHGLPISSDFQDSIWYNFGAKATVINSDADFSSLNRLIQERTGFADIISPKAATGDWVCLATSALNFNVKFAIPLGVDEKCLNHSFTDDAGNKARCKFMHGTVRPEDFAALACKKEENPAGLKTDRMLWVSLYLTMAWVRCQGTKDRYLVYIKPTQDRGFENFLQKYYFEEALHEARQLRSTDGENEFYVPEMNFNAKPQYMIENLAKLGLNMPDLSPIADGAFLGGFVHQFSIETDSPVAAADIKPKLAGSVRAPIWFDTPHLVCVVQGKMLLGTVFVADASALVKI